ncbi:hypothetical protein HC251_11910 [Iamia sp. SCSIO 61187]|uniref:hypothetical protein n=1 Tax=Iamia sp. SCSIO 61187 TaxID=2722752 RepID=UPI001C626DB2|nr:hypothetical protein [Iamia sp. SCSIO 61187]QYG90963.1 hypothetical protein HC251_11910 [Iamia sp. SCSIO 61187]
MRRARALALAGLLVATLAACNVVDLGGSTALTVAADGSVPVVVRCTGGTACSGTVRVRVGGRDSPFRSFSAPAGGSRSVVVRLTSDQQAAVAPGATVTGEVRIKENAPADLPVRGLAVTLTRAAPPEPPTSKAYRERNWTPTARDTCSADLHRSFSVVGPDGKLYPTWHPPAVVDPATGQECTFGHEHGDDPSSSDIYTWVTDFLDADPARGRGIPFGYVSEALDTWSATTGAVTRHEDNVGHKVVVADDVRMVTASPRGYVRDDAGQIVTCDVLMKVHQGSHSGDALVNNAHELLYAARCTDGTEVISSTMTRFGDANEFNRSCDGQLVTTAGSDLPDGDGGLRLIPDQHCIDRDVLVPPDRTSSIWALYEVWQSANTLTTADGAPLASFDPWFGVRNPARAHAGGVNNLICSLVDVTDMTDAADGGTARGYPFDEVARHEASTGAQLDRTDPASPFDGAQRDFYLHTTEVTNAGGPTTWFTDPYGGDAVTAATPGRVRQHVSSTSNDHWPDLERRSFDLQRDHGHANGVHAPN